MQFPYVEKRRVHSIGDGGLAILLPKPWASSRKIKAGDEVIVIAGDDRLTIEPATPERIKEIKQAVEQIILRGKGHGR